MCLRSLLIRGEIYLIVLGFHPLNPWLSSATAANQVSGQDCGHRPGILRSVQILGFENVHWNQSGIPALMLLKTSA